MRRIEKAVLAMGIGLSVASFAPGADIPSATLAALDPSRIAASICGAKDAGRALARELLIAAAFAAPTGAAGGIPRYPELTAAPLPGTTSDPEARRYFSQGLLATTLLFLIYLGIVIRGYFVWRREQAQQRLAGVAA